ncbi:MAG: hypothetical protein QMD08_07150 [Actinomycetota bacterium]|nr:hypothetical protein [Actinomycetota bacterium]
MKKLVGYFKERPYRAFYWGALVLVYLSALFQAVTPLAVLPKAPIYCPEKREIQFVSPSAASRIKGYFGENFYYPGGDEGVWMSNHAFIILDNLSHQDVKANVSFRVRYLGLERELQVRLGDSVLKELNVGTDLEKIVISKLKLEPGETLVYFYTPQDLEKAPDEFKLGEGTEVSLGFDEFKIEPLGFEHYTTKEKLKMVKQEILHLIDSINYIYTSIAAFILLGVALALHFIHFLKESDRASP